MDSVVAARKPGDGVGPDDGPVEKCRLITSTDPMRPWKNYLLPESLPQALQLMITHNPDCLIVSGGTDLLLEIQQEHRPPVETLIDVTRIPELNLIEIRGDRLFIGAGVPLKLVSTSALVLQHAQALAESTGQIGGPQVRAVGTLGGNVGHALPAGDGAISLLALDAQAEVASTQGSRRVPLLQLYKGPGLSALQPGSEIIVGFDVALQNQGQSSAFSRVMRPQGVALPMLNMAAWLEAQDGKITQCRLAVGPAGPVPRRAHPVEEFLAGKEMTADTLKEANSVLHQSIQFRSSPLRASSYYRDHLAEVLLERVLTTAMDRAMQTITGRRQP